MYFVENVNAYQIQFDIIIRKIYSKLYAYLTGGEYITMTNENLGKNIQSVQRAIDIIECFNETRIELSLNEISKIVGVNKSTVHGILNTLHNNGYIRQNDERKYLLGQAILDKYRYLSRTLQSLIISLSRPYMQKISNTHKLTINLFVVSEGRAIFSSQVISHLAKYAFTQVSNNSPLYSTATGKLTLSQMSNNDLDNYINSVKLEKISNSTIDNIENLKRNLTEIRLNGYSYEDQELVEGVSAISVPIFNKIGYWIGAMSVVGVALYISKNKNIIIDDLKKTCSQISQKL